jgi:hypothetical protein
LYSKTKGDVEELHFLMTMIGQMKNLQNLSFIFNQILVWPNILDALAVAAAKPFSPLPHLNSAVAYSPLLFTLPVIGIFFKMFCAEYLEILLTIIISFLCIVTSGFQNPWTFSRSSQKIDPFCP